MGREGGFLNVSQTPATAYKPWSWYMVACLAECQCKFDIISGSALAFVTSSGFKLGTRGCDWGRVALTGSKVLAKLNASCA